MFLILITPIMYSVLKSRKSTMHVFTVEIIFWNQYVNELLKRLTQKYL
ncbi:MAG: hypothetical protein ACTS8Y_02380 [Arsenophonus sp. ER-EMS1-MAG3]